MQNTGCAFMKQISHSTALERCSTKLRSGHSENHLSALFKKPVWDNLRLSQTNQIILNKSDYLKQISSTALHHDQHPESLQK